MKIALLGTGFGQAHVAVYAQRADVDEVIVFGRSPAKLAKIGEDYGFATSTDLDGLITDGSVDLVDICLPTRLHADVAIRALQAGKDVLIELPLAGTLEDARRIVAAHQATGQMAFVDMFSRFSPANKYLRQAVADGRYGTLHVLEIDGRTALLWPGYELGLDTLALNMMHADFDLATSLFGRPAAVHVACAAGQGGRGSAAEAILGYPNGFARCTSSSLMPVPYGMRGGWRATFTGGVLEYAMRAGFTGQGPATLNEHTVDGEKLVDLPAASPYEAMIDHVLACLAGRAENQIEPASALIALELTLDVHQRLTPPAGQIAGTAGRRSRPGRDGPPPPSQ